jgi:hypothetical protein
MATALAAAAFGPHPIDLEAMGLAQALVTGDRDAFGQVDVDGDAGHGRPWQIGDRRPPFPPVDIPAFQFKKSAPARIAQIRWISQFKTEEPNQFDA